VRDIWEKARRRSGARRASFIRDDRAGQPLLRGMRVDGALIAGAEGGGVMWVGFRSCGHCARSLRRCRLLRYKVHRPSRPCSLKKCKARQSGRIGLAHFISVVLLALSAPSISDAPARAEARPYSREGLERGSSGFGFLLGWGLNVPPWTSGRQSSLYAPWPPCRGLSPRPQQSQFGNRHIASSGSTPRSAASPPSNYRAGLRAAVRATI